MKIKTFLLLIVLLLSNIRASAKEIPIFYSYGIDVEKVIDLPEKEEYTIEDENGRSYHADLGIMHEQFSIFGVPLFNYGEEEYVLFYEGATDYKYVDLSRDEIKYLRELYPSISLTPELPFWDVWGGKLLALLIIGLIFLFTIIKNS
jgi:hypothetical protein